MRTLPPSLSVRLAYDIATSPFRSPDADTFDAIVRASLGRTMAERFYAPYVEKLFGVPATELAGELARRRVGAGSAAALVRRVVRPNPDRGIFFYPRRGYGQISEALAAAATDAGAEIRTATEVTALRAPGDRVEVDTGDGTTITAASAWSTLPLALLSRLAGAPGPVRDAGNHLETRAMVLVYLALPLAQWTPYDAHYFPERDVLVSRVSEPKNYRDSAEDPHDLTVLCAEIPCALGDDRWSATPDALAGEVRDALTRSDLPTPAPIDVVVRRVPARLPRVPRRLRATAGRARRVGRRAATRPQLRSSGTLRARQHASRARDGLGRRRRVDGSRSRRRGRWARARADFATHVVED